MKKLLVYLILSLLAFRVGAYERAIVLAPSIAEIFAYLDLTDYVVGRVEHCDYPEEIRNKPLVGDFSNPNEEIILSLKPDIIFGVDIEQERFKKRFEKYGIPIYSFAYNNIQDIIESMHRILKIMDKETPARLRKIEDFRKRLAALKATKVKGTGVFLIWDKPLMVASTKSFISDIMEYAGIKNVMEIKREYSQISPEMLVKYNPDYIILGYMDKDRKMYDRFVKKYSKLHLKAVDKGGIIYDIDPDILLRPGPRIIEGIKALKHQISR